LYKVDLGKSEGPILESAIANLKFAIAFTLTQIHNLHPTPEI